ncbi:hypothetical protein LLB_1988 [Legionella longbeachae D-4968]|nr:hypothetical protein LLB_1988 [Legionella longbeachae D-4968]
MLSRDYIQCQYFSAAIIQGLNSKITHSFIIEQKIKLTSI